MIYIGAGHSQSDPGAISRDGRLREADLATRLRDKISNALDVMCVPHRTDGAPGINQPLRDSIAIAKTCGPVRVEIHFNAGPPLAQGCEVLSLPVNKQLAQDIAAAITFHTKSPRRGEKGWKSDSSGQHSRLAFCREGRGCVVEVAFISNAAEMRRYLAVEDAVADAIAAALASHANPD